MQYVEKQRCGNVVRQIAQQAERSFTGNGGEIHLQGVADMQMHGRIVVKLCSETFSQVAVDFHQMQFHTCLDQRGGQRGLTGANLDQQLTRLWCN